MRQLWLLLAVSILLACGETSEPGVMLVMYAPAGLEDDIAQLHVIVRSGYPKEGALEQRGDETVDVEEWPAEVFVRATDTKRTWEAEIYALDANGKVVAGGLIDGVFLTKGTFRLKFELANLPEQDGAGSSGTERDASAPKHDAAQAATSHDAGEASHATGTTRDAGPARHDASADAGWDGAIADAGSAPRDSGGSGADAARDATLVDSSGGFCPGASSYPQDTACQRCTCARCAMQTTRCFASSDPSKNTRCAAVRSCAEVNTCLGQQCYCGSSLLCLEPDGPCRESIHTAVGSDEPSAVQNASMDPESPMGRSVAVGECQAQNCRSECGI